MSLESLRESLQIAIKSKEDELANLRRQLDEVETEYQEKVGRVYAGVTIKTRKASYVLTAPNGKAVTLSRNRNAYNERNVYWYDGKKGALALELTRWNSNRIARWLSEQ